MIRALTQTAGDVAAAASAAGIAPKDFLGYGATTIAVGAVIYVVQMFLKNQRESLTDFRSTLKENLEGFRETLSSIEESRKERDKDLKEAMQTMSTRVNDLAIAIARSQA